MSNIYYKVHLILQSKYKILVHLLIILVFYSILYSNKVIFCMNDATNSLEAPIIAEAKETVKPSHQTIGIRRNIQAYAGSLASHLESRDQIIEELQQETTQLKDLIFNQNNDNQVLRSNNEALQSEIKSARTQNIEKDRTINSLNAEIEGYSWYPDSGYKSKIEKMEKQIIELRRDLHISNALLDEAKRDKEKLFSLVSEAIEKR